MKTTAFLSIFSFLIIAATAKSQECHESGNQPHGMAPIGVMGGHTHAKGHFMSTYRLMNMNMSGLSTQGNLVTTEFALESSMMAPTNMNMQMHMLGLMYAPLERLTIMGMVAYNHTRMDMASYEMHMDNMDGMMGGTMHKTLTNSEMSNSGLGDVKLSGLYRITMKETSCLHAIGGLSFPTGSVTAENAMGMRLPYPMQNGSGTVGAFVGLNYSSMTNFYLWGAQWRSGSPLMDNKEGYRTSHTHELTAWGARKITSWMSFSVRAKGMYQSAISEMDAQINPMMSPLGNPDNLEMYRIDAFAGVNLRPWRQIRIAAELGMPLNQYNYGVNMQNKMMSIVGVQFLTH